MIGTADILNASNLIVDDKKANVQLLEKMWVEDILPHYIRMVMEGGNGQN